MLAKRGPAAERYKFPLWAYILPTVATRGDMSAALCAITVAHTCPHEVLQLSAINSPCGPTSCRQLPLGTADLARKTVSGLHGSAALAQCGSADVGPIKYGRACPVPRRRGRPGGGPLWEFEIGPPLGQRDIAVWEREMYHCLRGDGRPRSQYWREFIPKIYNAIRAGKQIRFFETKFLGFIVF